MKSPGISSIPRDVTDCPMRLKVRTLLDALLHEGRVGCNLDAQVLWAVLGQKNARFLEAFRDQLCAELEGLAMVPRTAENSLSWDCYKGNLLALLPYSEPPDGMPVDVPVVTDGGEVSRQTYSCTTLPLGIIPGLSPMIALGLTHQTLPAILSFSGTTHPTCEGFMTTLLADTTPGVSVGTWPFEANKGKIATFFLGKRDVHVVGQSLGGALCLDTLRAFSSHIARVDAYSPPGKYSWGALPADHQVCVNIYMQKGDIVPQIGFFPTAGNINVYRIQPTSDSGHGGPIAAHARAFSGCREIDVEELDVQAENKRVGRIALTILHAILSPIFVFLPLLLTAIVYVILKAIVMIITYPIFAIMQCFRGSVQGPDEVTL